MQLKAPMKFSSAYTRSRALVQVQVEQKPSEFFLDKMNKYPASSLVQERNQTNYYSSLDQNQIYPTLDQTVREQIDNRITNYSADLSHICDKKKQQVLLPFQSCEKGIIQAYQSERVFMRETHVTVRGRGSLCWRLYLYQTGPERGKINGEVNRDVSNLSSSSSCISGVLLPPACFLAQIRWFSNFQARGYAAQVCKFEEENKVSLCSNQRIPARCCGDGDVIEKNLYEFGRIYS